MLDTYKDFYPLHIESEGGAEDLRSSFLLRYETYCLEKNFLPPPSEERLEVDDFDNDEIRTHHFIVKNVAAGNVALGTSRLVPYSEKAGLPTAQHYPEIYEHLRKAGCDTRRIFEFSRLCIARSFRRREQPPDGFYGVESYVDPIADERRRYPIILLLLIKKMYEISHRERVDYWLATMEDSLVRFLNMSCITCTPLTDHYIEFYGKVKPFLIDINSNVEKMRKRRPDLYTLLIAS